MTTMTSEFTSIMLWQHLWVLMFINPFIHTYLHYSMRRVWKLHCRWKNCKPQNTKEATNRTLLFINLVWTHKPLIKLLFHIGTCIFPMQLSLRLDCHWKNLSFMVVLHVFELRMQLRPSLYLPTLTFAFFEMREGLLLSLNILSIRFRI